MILKSIHGQKINAPHAEKFLIDWNAQSRSNFQSEVKKFLYNYWQFHVVFEEFTIPKTRLSLDFFNKTLNVAVEVQGAQHNKYIKHFHGNHNINFLRQLKRDDKKLKFCENFGIKLVEIYPNDILSKELFANFGVIL